MADDAKTDPNWMFEPSSKPMSIEVSALGLGIRYVSTVPEHMP